MSPNVAIRDIVGGVTAPKGFRAAGVSCGNTNAWVRTRPSLSSATIIKNASGTAVPLGSLDGRAPNTGPASTHTSPNRPG